MAFSKQRHIVETASSSVYQLALETSPSRSCHTGRTVTVVYTRARLSPEPSCQKDRGGRHRCRVQTPGRRWALYATSGGSRMAVIVDTSWNHARSCQQSRRRRSPCSANTTEGRCLAGPTLRFWSKSCPAKHQSVHVLLVRPLNFDRLDPAWTVHHFNIIHCASVAERVVFIAPLLCNNSSAPAVSQTLSICRHVGPT